MSKTVFEPKSYIPRNDLTLRDAMFYYNKDQYNQDKDIEYQAEACIEECDWFLYTKPTEEYPESSLGISYKPIINNEQNMSRQDILDVRNDLVYHLNNKEYNQNDKKDYKRKKIFKKIILFASIISLILGIINLIKSSFTKSQINVYQDQLNSGLIQFNDYQSIVNTINNQANTDQLISFVFLFAFIVLFIINIVIFNKKKIENDYDVLLEKVNNYEDILKEKSINLHNIVYSAISKEYRDELEKMRKNYRDELDYNRNLEAFNYFKDNFVFYKKKFYYNENMLNKAMDDRTTDLDDCPAIVNNEFNGLTVDTFKKILQDYDLVSDEYYDYVAHKKHFINDDQCTLYYAGFSNYSVDVSYQQVNNVNCKEERRIDFKKFKKEVTEKYPMYFNPFKNDISTDHHYKKMIKEMDNGVKYTVNDQFKAYIAAHNYDNWDIYTKIDFCELVTRLYNNNIPRTLNVSINNLTEVNYKLVKIYDYIKEELMLP